MWLSVALFRFNLFWVLWGSWIWMSVSLLRFGKFAVIIALNILSVSLFLLEFPLYEYFPFSLCSVIPTGFLYIFSFFFFLFALLGNSQCPILQDADSFFYIIEFETLSNLEFSYCIFQL